MPLLTFLVSFYNAEKYIASCIKNLKKQTYSDFLCILVDDGSSDKSIQTAKKEIGSDKRFSLIQHEKNLGIGAGRATGIENTKTEFLTFIDADDELKLEATDIIISNIENQPADLYVYDYFQKSIHGKTKYETGSASSVNELFKNNDKRISHVWHKIYRTSTIKNMDLSFYKTLTFSEDLHFCVKAFLASKKTAFINEAYYYYIYNPNSLVHSRSEKNIQDNINVLKKLLNDNEIKNNPDIESYIKNDSYYASGQLIFPNKRNLFQWEKPHFDEWRKIDEEIKIFIPKNISIFVRFYLNLIKQKHDFTAFILWNILKFKELFK